MDNNTNQSETAVDYLQHLGEDKMLQPSKLAELKEQFMTRGILVFTGISHMRLDWPSPEKVDEWYNERTRRHGGDDHLEMGITLGAADDFLVSISFPLWYARPDELVKRNGPLKKGQETGYDMAHYIRVVFKVLGYNKFSVVEVLEVAGYPGEGLGELPRYFLSHAQSERWTVTKCGMWHASRDKMSWWLFYFGWIWQTRVPATCPAFVDYFCLRQLQSDFERLKIKALIAKIGHTILLLAGPSRPPLAYQLSCPCSDADTSSSSDGDGERPARTTPDHDHHEQRGDHHTTCYHPVVFTRIFCIFEIKCTDDARTALLSGVCMEFGAFFDMLRHWNAQSYDVEKAEASNQEDKDAIIGSIRDQGQVDTINRRLNTVTLRFASSTIWNFVLAAFMMPVVCCDMYATISGSAADRWGNVTTIVAAIIGWFANPLSRYLRIHGVNAGPLVLHAGISISAAFIVFMVGVGCMVNYLIWRARGDQQRQMLNGHAAFFYLSCAVLGIFEWAFFRRNSGTETRPSFRQTLQTGLIFGGSGLLIAVAALTVLWQFVPITDKPWALASLAIADALFLFGGLCMKACSWWPQRRSKAHETLNSYERLAPLDQAV